MFYKNLKSYFALGAIIVAAGCQTLPENIAELDEAREAVAQVEKDPLSRDAAAPESGSFSTWSK